MRSILTLLSIVSVGIMAGLFFSWSVSVMPGLKKLGDREFISAMKSMNRAIQNPLFFTCFFGALILLLISCFSFYQVSMGLDYYLLLSSTVIYTIGVVGITIAGNVPLNNMLDNFQLSGATDAEAAMIRTAFENKWNYLNNLRTGLNVVAFCLLIIRLTR